MSIKENLAPIPVEWNARWVVCRYHDVPVRYVLSIVENGTDKTLVEHILGLPELVEANYDIIGMSQKLIDSRIKQLSLDTWLQAVPDEIELPLMFTYSVSEEGVTIKSTDPGFSKTVTNEADLQKVITEVQTIRRIYDLLSDDVEES